MNAAARQRGRCSAKSTLGVGDGGVALSIQIIPTDWPNGLVHARPPQQAIGH